MNVRIALTVALSSELSCRLRGREELNLDLGAELDDLAARHAEERGGTFGVALQEGKQILAPQPHARNISARNDGLAADIARRMGRALAKPIMTRQKLMGIALLHPSYALNSLCCTLSVA